VVRWAYSGYCTTWFLKSLRNTSAYVGEGKGINSLGFYYYDELPAYKFQLDIHVCLVQCFRQKDIMKLSTSNRIEGCLIMHEPESPEQVSPIEGVKDD
jgi:hypothetical protein